MRRSYLSPPPKGSKYHNVKFTFNGIKFDSKKEMLRYCELKRLTAAGKIKKLELQKEFELIPTQRFPDIVGKRGGVKKGKVIEHSIKYIADFVYVDEDGKTVVEDVKGYRGGGAYEIFKIKRKLMLYIYGIKISEI